jgi:hypothetical protein
MTTYCGRTRRATISWVVISSRRYGRTSNSSATHLPAVAGNRPCPLTPGLAPRGRSAASPNVTLLFGHVFEDGWVVGRVVPAYPVLPGGHPGAAGDHQPRPGPGPRQPLPAHHEPAPRECGGLRLTGYCPGRLHAWVRLNTGTWMGECTFTVHSGNQRAALELRQWLPASAITPQRH